MFEHACSLLEMMSRNKLALLQWVCKSGPPYDMGSWLQVSGQGW